MTEKTEKIITNVTLLVVGALTLVVIYNAVKNRKKTDEATEGKGDRNIKFIKD